MITIEIDYKLIKDDKRTPEEKKLDDWLAKYGAFDENGIWRNKK